jgi:multidrug efflux pump subunit AcrA (membrane-fusion protein)
MRGGGEGARGSLIFVLSDKGVPEPRRVRLGISDGQFVEVTEGLEEGSRVVTGVDSGLAPAGPPRPGGSPSTNPFNPTPQFQQRRRG